MRWPTRRLARCGDLREGLTVARRPSSLGALARGVLWAGFALAALFAELVALYAFVDPVSTLMLARTLEGKRYERTFVRLDAVAPAAVAAVIASEDATFCQNDGVDWGALHEVLRGARGGEPKRGASTITMQTAKNLFLWPGRSFVRKGIEIGMALVLGKVWSKRRVMQNYLNVAEWATGSLASKPPPSAISISPQNARRARGRAARDRAAQSDQAQPGQATGLAAPSRRRRDGARRTPVGQARVCRAVRGAGHPPATQSIPRAVSPSPAGGPQRRKGAAFLPAAASAGRAQAARGRQAEAEVVGDFA